MYLPFFVFGGVLSRPDCTTCSAFLQFTNTRIISRPLLSFFALSSTTTTPFFAFSFPVARFEISASAYAAQAHSLSFMCLRDCSALAFLYFWCRVLSRLDYYTICRRLVVQYFLSKPVSLPSSNSLQQQLRFFFSFFRSSLRNRC